MAAEVDFLMKNKDILTEHEAAEMLTMSVSWLRQQRYSDSGGPPFIRMGRSIRYSRQDLKEYFSKLPKSRGQK
jgi:predicted DNA-binding transcriptional regulator AlpA